MLITLTWPGVVSAVMLNVEKVASNAEDKVQISVYLDYDSTDGAKEVTDLAGQTSANASYPKIDDLIKAIDGVTSSTYSSKDQELKKLQKTSSDIYKSLEGDAIPLQDVY